jgi:hypothetical protein
MLGASESAIYTQLRRHGIKSMRIHEMLSYDQWFRLAESCDHNVSEMARQLRRRDEGMRRARISPSGVSRALKHHGIYAQPQQGRRRLLMDFSDDALLEMYRRNGYSKVRMAKALGVSEFTVMNEWRRRDLPTKRGGTRHPFTREDLIELHHERGLSPTMAGRVYGCTSQAIIYALKRYGVERRRGRSICDGEPDLSPPRSWFDVSSDESREATPLDLL